MHSSPGTRLAAPGIFRGVFRIDDEARGVYAEAAGIQRIWPLAVAVPADALDVVTLVEWAAETEVPLIPRGSGSSMGGGAVGSGVVVDLSRLRDRGPVHQGERRITVGPGVLCAEVNAAAAHFGLRLPVDPSSAEFCTVGGMVATNAAGAHTLKYGSMRPWVEALDCVFADGARALVCRGTELSPAARRIPAVDRFLSDVAPAVLGAEVDSLCHPGVRKESSGYALADYARSGELIDLLVGSEGTLAMFVGVEVRLAPRAGGTASLLAAYATLDAAVVGAAVARVSGASACELLDRTFLDIAREGEGSSGLAGSLPADSDAVLLIEVEADDPASALARARVLERELADAGAVNVSVARDAASEAALWELRHAASPALARLDPALKSMQVIEDGCVPPDRLADYVRGVRAALARHRCRAAIFGHAGDAHVHVNPLIDVRDPTWRARVEALLADVTLLTAELGGTLTGEHGDGRLRAPLLPAVWGGKASTAMRLFGDIKRAFDPGGRFNPGAKIATPGERSLDEVKYDPALPLLPANSRRALDLVTDTRAYAESRLALLDRKAARG